MLRRGSHGHGPSSELRPVETSSVRSISDASNDHCNTKMWCQQVPHPPSSPQSTCPSGRFRRIDEWRRLTQQRRDKKQPCQHQMRWVSSAVSHYLHKACGLNPIPIEEMRWMMSRRELWAKTLGERVQFWKRRGCPCYKLDVRWTEAAWPLSAMLTNARSWTGLYWSYWRFFRLQFTGPICHHHPHDTIGISPSENLKVSLIRLIKSTWKACAGSMWPSPPLHVPWGSDIRLISPLPTGSLGRRKNIGKPNRTLNTCSQWHARDFGRQKDDFGKNWRLAYNIKNTRRSTCWRLNGTMLLGSPSSSAQGGGGSFKDWTL